MSLFLDIEKQLGSFHLKAKLETGDDVLALLGASGCGKSMTLKCIAGIQKPDRGKIVVDGITLFDSQRRINLTPQQRRTGLLFQNYALFPNMTVLQNIQAGARRERDPIRQKQSVEQMIADFGLAELIHHYPAQLSGGQQQRTALARILVSNPRILLLDEPFSALDSHLRFRLEQQVREVLRSFGKTAVLVSHDRDEVFRLSDQIAVMNQGTVEVFGPKEAVFSNPQTPSAALLTGCKNISAIEKIDNFHVKALDWGISIATEAPVGDAKSIGIRMHDVAAGPGPNAFSCNVVEEIQNPFSYTIMLRPNGTSGAPIGWEVDIPTWQRLRASQVEIHLPPQKAVLLQGAIHAET